MKYSHAVISLVAATAFLLFNSIYTILPWSLVTPIYIGAGIIGLLLWSDAEIFNTLNQSSTQKKDLAVDPNEATEYINRKAEEINGYKKLNLDSTHRDNTKLHTRLQKVNENGEEKVKFGVVGAPLHQEDKESIAYVVHCDEGYLEYSGELHSARERLDPFNGKHRWLVNAGYKSQIRDAEDEEQGYGRGGVNIYQGPPKDYDGEEQV